MKSYAKVHKYQLEQKYSSDPLQQAIQVIPSLTYQNATNVKLNSSTVLTWKFIFKFAIQRQVTTAKTNLKHIMMNPPLMNVKFAFNLSNNLKSCGHMTLSMLILQPISLWILKIVIKPLLQMKRLTKWKSWLMHEYQLMQQRLRLF